MDKQENVNKDVTKGQRKREKEKKIKTRKISQKT